MAPHNAARSRENRHELVRSGDRQLGMDRPITRRDFLNGVALATAGLAATTLLPGAAHATTPASYPPKLAGLRGHSETAMNIMHAVRDGTFWDSAPEVADNR